MLSYVLLEDVQEYVHSAVQVVFGETKTEREFIDKCLLNRVVDEMEYMYNTYNVRFFWFTDNSFEDPGFSTERQSKIAEEIIKRKLEISYAVDYKVGFYKHASDDFMKLMIKSGLKTIFLGIEAGNDADLELYKKRTTAEDNYAAYNFFRSYKELQVQLGFITINPYTDLDRLQSNVHFLHRINKLSYLNYLGHRFISFKGTQLHEKLKEDGLLTGDLFEGGYGVKYIHNEIVNFNDYFDEIRENNLYIMLEIEKLCVYFPEVTIPYLISEAEKRNDIEAKMMIENLFEKFDKMARELNDSVKIWMDCVIDSLREGTFDKQKQDSISQEWFYGKGKILDILKRMLFQKQLFSVKLVRYNYEYNKLIGGIKGYSR